MFELSDITKLSKFEKKFEKNFKHKLKKIQKKFLKVKILKRKVQRL